jgi:hypothetical protein
MPDGEIGLVSLIFGHSGANIKMNNEGVFQNPLNEPDPKTLGATAPGVESPRCLDHLAHDAGVT